jgi:hypothetical protein
MERMVAITESSINESYVEPSPNAWLRSRTPVPTSYAPACAPLYPFQGVLENRTSRARGMTVRCTKVVERKFSSCIEIWQFELESCVWRVSFHKYAYVHGDPVQMIDPTGMFGVGSTFAGTSIASSIAGIKNSVDMSILSAFQMLSDATTIGMTEQELLYQMFVVNNLGFDPLSVANSLYTLFFNPPAIVEAEDGRVTRQGYQNIISLISQSVESIFEDDPTDGNSVPNQANAMASGARLVPFTSISKPLGEAFAAFGNLSNKMRGRAFDALKSDRFMRPATAFQDSRQQGIHFASAKATLDGIGSWRIHAFSGGIDMSRVLPNEGFVSNGNKAMLPFAVKNAGNMHSEWKILNEIAQSGVSRITKGKVTLFSELRPCSDSCQDVIKEFSKRFPRIKISVIYVTPKPGYFKS